MKKALIATFAGMLILSATARAAITITISPDGSGGTLFAFAQPTANPVVPVALVSAGAFLGLPPGMFDPSLYNPAAGEISGSFPALAQFRDVNAGVGYNVTGLLISLTFARFTFDREFTPGSNQSEVQFVLQPQAPGQSTIAPEALVPGTHTISSALFGTVTVTVVPEPTGLLWLSAAALWLQRRRRTFPSPSAGRPS